MNSIRFALSWSRGVPGVGSEEASRFRREDLAVRLAAKETVSDFKGYLIWPFVLAGVAIAFLLEWRNANASASQH